MMTNNDLQLESEGNYSTYTLPSIILVDPRSLQPKATLVKLI